MPLLLPPSIPGSVEKAVETRARLRSVAIRLSSTICRCHAPNKFPRSPRRPHFPRSHFPRRIEIGRAIWIPRGERQREKERDTCRQLAPPPDVVRSPEALSIIIYLEA